MRKIEITDRKFLTQYLNGATFATNPTTVYSKYPMYNIGEKARVVMNVLVSVITEADSTIQIKAETDGSYIKMTHPINSWDYEGFVVGVTVRIEAKGNNISESVIRIQGREMWISDTSFFSTLGTTDGDKRDDYVLKVTTRPTNMTFKFGIVPNDQLNNTYNSLITGEEQAYSVSGLALITTRTANYLGSTQSDLNSSLTVYSYAATGTGSYIFPFDITHTFEWPGYIEEYQTALKEGSVPDQFKGFNSYRYVTAYNFNNNKRNPNALPFVVDDFMKGSIGSFDQNFNGGKVDYTLNSYTIQVGGNDVDSIDVDNTNSITLQIQRDGANFSSGVKAYAYHAKLATKDEYNEANTYSENFVLDSHFETDGGGTTSSNIIQSLNVAINAIDTTKLDITFNLVYGSAEKAFIENGDYYLLGISVADSSLATEESDRVTVWIDCNQFVKSSDQSGLITSNQINMFNSAQDPAIATPYTSAQTNVGGLYKISGTFNLAKSADSSDALLNNFAVGILAYNSTTGDYFWLSKTVFSLGDTLSPDVLVNVDGTDYQAINFEGTNSLGVPDDHDFNKLILQSTVPGAYSATQAWDFECAVEFSWRDWIYNPDVAKVFYSRDRATFNNLNFNASNYSNISGYTIYVAASMTLTSGGFDTDYFLLSDACDVVEFGDDTFASGWTGAIEYFDENGNQMENGLWMGGDVKCVVTFDNPGALITIADYVGEVMTEPSGGSSRAWRLHSSQDYRDPENPLKPIDGQDYLYFYQTAGTPNTLTLEFMIKNEYIVYGRPINIYPMFKKK